MWIHLCALLGEVHSIKPTFAMTGMQTHSRGPPASGPLSSVLWKEYKILKGGYVKWLKSPLFSITIGRRHHVHSFSVWLCLLFYLIGIQDHLPVPHFTRRYTAHASRQKFSFLLSPGFHTASVEHNEAGCLLFSLINARLVNAPLWGQAIFSLSTQTGLAC